jgi:heat shock protein HtpX
LSSASSDEHRFKLKQLDNVVEEIAIAAGLPKPKVYVVPDPDPNAFATGRDPQHASIAVTSGLLDLLTREELQGVVAHELSHVRNLDVRVLTVIAALVGAVALLSDWALRGMRYGALRGDSGSSREKHGGRGALGLVLFVLWLATAIVAPLVGQLLAMAVSRGREYLADASGAELTRNPAALADALDRIDRAVEPTKAIKRGSAHLCIADPLGRTVGIREGFWPDLLATHPPMKNRIAALRQMAYQH